MSRRHPGWKALGEAVTPGARVSRLHRLTGGAGGTDVYDATLDQAPRRVVVKLYPDGDGTASSEWRGLELAQRITAPVPAPIAADLESAWFGRPAVVMSRLQGHPNVNPENTDSWVAALALALTQVHGTALGGAAALTPSPPPETWDPPAGERDPRTAAAVSAVRARLPSLTSERVFTHGDFHPGNVLWQRGRISGIVDWGGARVGARWSELAYCRADVCLLLGPDVADRLADSYSEIVGETSDELAVYDLIWLLNIRHYAQVALGAYAEQGHVPNHSRSLAYVDEQLRRVLARLD